MDDLQPGAVFGEINMIQGTLCNASFRGETEGTVYIISKEQFLLALSQSDDVPQSLIPPTTYLGYLAVACRQL
jgi:CRP-like cAMP-binding protein